MTDFLAILSRLSDWQNLVDLLLVTLIFFALLRLLRGTQAANLVLGILIIGVLVFVITRTVELTALSLLLRSSSVVIFVAIPSYFPAGDSPRSGAGRAENAFLLAPFKWRNGTFDQ